MDELTRFARRLVEQLSASKEGVNRAVPIGLVREKILPYRTHRQALMLDSVEDYETVLLRLVAGERGFVRTLPTAAARRCQEELAGANPDLGVLDEVADSTIQITSLAAAQIVGDETEEALVTEAKGPKVPEKAVTPSAAKESRRTAELTSVPGVTLSEVKRPVPKESPASSGDSQCPHCQHAMPSGRQVVFCPWCGGRIIPFTCARCQTELDSEWRHCITCGSPVRDPYRFT